MDELGGKNSAKLFIVGHFGLAKVLLSGNLLTRLDPLVFQQMLEDMVNSSSEVGLGSFLQLDSSIFLCFF